MSYHMRSHDQHMIEDGENHSKEHLPHSQNDGHLHLVGVGEHQLVGRHLPYLQAMDHVRSHDTTR